MASDSDIRFLLLCIILLNQNQDLVLTTIMAIPMLLKIHLILFLARKAKESV